MCVCVRVWQRRTELSAQYRASAQNREQREREREREQESEEEQSSEDRGEKRQETDVMKIKSLGDRVSRACVRDVSCDLSHWE